MSHASSRVGERVRVGVTLTSGETRTALDDFCRALGAATGLEVTGIGFWYYQRLLDAIAMGDVDVAWLPPIPAAYAMSRGRATAIALPVRDGVTSYSTALFTREASPIRSVQELVGARAAWVDRQSVSGYLLIRAYLRAIGVGVERAFAEDRFVGSHEAVASEVLGGQADVGATLVYLDPERGRPLRAGWGSGRVRILAHAGPIPSDLIACSTRLPREAAARVQGALLQGRAPALRQAAAALIGAEAFAPPIEAHLSALTALLPGLDEHAQPRSSRWPRSSTA